MSSLDKLLTNTTNRLALQSLPSTSSTCHTSTQSFNKTIQMPIPIHPPKELSFLAKREEFLERQLEQAKQQQKMMLQLFESLCRVERGQAKQTKKLNRRCNKDIIDHIYCPHDDCKRFYSSEATLQRHVKLKHKIIKKDPPLPFRDLPPPEPNSITQNDSCEEILSQESSDHESNSQIYAE